MVSRIIIGLIFVTVFVAFASAQPRCNYAGASCTHNVFSCCTGLMCPPGKLVCTPAPPTPPPPPPPPPPPTEPEPGPEPGPDPGPGGYYYSYYRGCGSAGDPCGYNGLNCCDGFTCPFHSLRCEAVPEPPEDYYMYK